MDSHSDELTRQRATRNPSSSLALLVVLFVLPLSLLPRPARAIDEWYDYYLRARDRDIPTEDWEACVENVRQALRLRPQAAVNVQTYGLQFVDYLPHLLLGQCLLRQDKYREAIDAFDRAERAGAVARSPRRAELIRLQNEARSKDEARITRRARAEVQRLVDEAHSLARGRSWDEALALLEQAEVLAGGLDADTLQSITHEQERLVDLQRTERETAQRRQRIQQRLADGDRLLDEGSFTEAMVAYNEVIDVDPRNARALQGQRRAQERIQASRTRAQLQTAYQEGRQFFDAGRYEAALEPLTEAAAGLTDARELLDRTRQVIERLRNQRELRVRIEELWERGEELMAEGLFPEAQVAFEALLQLDPGHARAQERLAEAERRTGEALFARWFPNRKPTLALLPGEGPIVEGPTYLLQGVAQDDRQIRMVEVRVGGELVEEVPASGDAVNPVRLLPFVLTLPLEPGPNDVTVTVTDASGLTDSVPFTVERRLRFFETPLFLPSAGGLALGLVGLGFVAQRVRRRRAMRRRFNPYIAGAPVLDDDMYYGRERLTARMLSTLHRNSLMITGERRIGKTTFLHHLGKVLAADEDGEWRFFPVFVDLQGVPEQAFFHALMSEVVEALAIAPGTRDTLRLRPQTEGYEAREFSHDLQRVIAELKTRTDHRVKLALLIDEVDVLNEYSESVNQRLRGIFMKSFSENLVAVMSGVGIRRRWKSEVSPWYNFFDEIELPPFSREEAEALVREPVAGVFRWKTDAVERILELSRLRPYLVQKYCVYAVNRMLEEGRGTIRLGHVEAARVAVELEAAATATEEPVPAEDAPVAD
jgi:tetratricopeptide (TPR) repeat protein